MVTASEVMKVNEMNREVKFRSAAQSAKYNKSIWIGLKINPAIKNLKDISFYFDWFNNPEKPFLIRSLQMTTWFYQQKEISVKSGYRFGR